MKICTKCGQKKELSEFYYYEARDQYTQPCKTCYSKQAKNRYRTNKTHRQIRDARIQKQREESRELIWDYLTTHPCIDCGESDPLVLQFDHRDPATKKKAVAVLANGWHPKVVGIEIAKCDVRCANCHIKRTGKQFNWWKHERDTSKKAGDLSS